MGSSIAESFIFICSGFKIFYHWKTSNNNITRNSVLATLNNLQTINFLYLKKESLLKANTMVSVYYPGVVFLVVLVKKKILEYLKINFQSQGAVCVTFFYITYWRHYVISN